MNADAVSAWLGEDFILLGTCKHNALNILTFYHKQTNPNYDHDWTPSITQVMKHEGKINESDYCCIVWSFSKFGQRVAFITPEFFDRDVLLLFLKGACLQYMTKENVRLVSFQGDGNFITQKIPKCFLKGPSSKRISKLCRMEKNEIGNITVYPIPGSDLARIIAVSKEIENEEITVEKIQVFGNDQPEEVEYRVCLRGEETKDPIPMRELYGWNEGPVGRECQLSQKELMSMMNEWLSSIPSDRVSDQKQVKAIQILLHSVCVDGLFFSKRGHMRFQILNGLSSKVKRYFMLFKEANSLSQ